MKNTVNKAMRIILSIFLFFLISCASMERKQSELRDAEFYNNLGITFGNMGQYDQAISDYTRALEIDPKGADAYYNRAVAYYSNREYEKSWADIKKAQDLGYKISSDFLDDLPKASGRQK